MEEIYIHCLLKFYSIFNLILLRLTICIIISKVTHKVILKNNHINFYFTIRNF